MRRPPRYTRFAAAYDLMSAEPVYRAGRRAGIAGLNLRAGDRVLDVGCGTGLNFKLLQDVVGPTGRVVGVDLSGDMLRQAEQKVRRYGWSNVGLVQADATTLADEGLPGEDDRPFDGVLFTYALSLMPHWLRAWRGAIGLLRPGGRAAVVDMQLPTGRAAVLSPLARWACHLGGADIDAHPWTALERDARDVARKSLRGGHIQVRSGTVDLEGAGQHGGEEQ